MTSSKTILGFVVLICTVAAHRSSAWTITTTFPPGPLIFAWRGDVSAAVFVADAALTSCQCKTYVTVRNNEPLIDLSLGHGSAVFRHDEYTASYSGTGLQFGQCGVQLRSVGFYYRLLICRGRAATGGWKYQQVPIIRANRYQHAITGALQNVFHPGTTAELHLSKTHGTPLKWCSILLPGDSGWTDTFATSNSSPGDKYSYSGRDLARGECNVGFNVTADTLSGVAWCQAETSDYLDSYLPTLLLIDAPPTSDPTITLHSGTTLTAGENITATCTVPASRPVANIIWLLGGRVIRLDHNNDAEPDLAWYWPWDKQSITQTLVQAVTTEDNGKQLVCQVQHVAVKGWLGASQIIAVTGAGTATNLTCGEQSHGATPLVAGGQDAVAGEFPWHAAIYRPNSKRKLDHICGGTLITHRVVISAAHCFWDASRGELRNISKYRVAVGKLLRSWDEDEDDDQKRGIEKVIIDESYYGVNALYQHDIAVVILRSPVALSSTVNVACVDWDNTLEAKQLTNGSSGIVAGHGQLLNGSLAETLQRVSLPWVARPTCRNANHINNIKFVTYDKLCAGHVNRNMSVCQGDSGGGLMFVDDATKRYYLRGVVSIALRPPGTSAEICFAQSYSLFTLVSKYFDLLLPYRDRT